MNNNIYFTFILSISVHGALFFVPCKLPLFDSLNANVVKGQRSIEVSLVQTMEPVRVKPTAEEKILEKRVHAPSREELPVEKPQKVSIPAPRTAIGAITEEVSALLTNQPPVYPSLARMKGWQGNVTLVAEVTKDGEVGDVTILSSSGYYALDSAATKAVRKWHFKNVYTKTQVKIPVKFILTQD